MSRDSALEKSDEPPSYNEAKIPALLPKTPEVKPREWLFFRGNGLTSKAQIRSSDGNRVHTLSASISSLRPSTITVHLGSSKTPALGSLLFPETHNDFQIHTSNPDAAPSRPKQISLLQVKARVGNPHPTTYHFTLPATATTPPRKTIWTIRRSSSATKHPTVCYSLTEEITNTPLAFWTTVHGAKHSAILRWHVPPRSEREEFIVMMSFVGCMSRLRLKGKEKLSDAGSGAARWGGMWFMAILGTAAVA